MAVGGVHPIVVAGCADGSVVVTNPLRRMYGNHRTKKDGGRFLLKVMKHEFRPTNNDASNQEPLSKKLLSITGAKDSVIAAADNHDDNSSTISAQKNHKIKGIVRLTEDYALEKAEIKAQTPKGEEPLIFSTLYEEASAAKAVAWNPNLRCGAWMAVGFASGLLRVVDLGV